MSKPKKGSLTLEELHEQPKDENTLKTFSELAKNADGSRQRTVRSWKITDIIFSKSYISFLLLRIIFLCLPGYFSNDEYNYTDLAARDILGLPVVVPEQMDLTPPCHSALGMFIITGYPFSLLKYLKNCLVLRDFVINHGGTVANLLFHSGFSIVFFSRLAPLFLSFVQDTLILRLCSRRSKLFAKQALYTFCASWPAICLFPRPTSAVWQSICLLGLMISLCATTKVNNMYYIYAFATAVGISIEPNFIVYGAGLLPLLLLGSKTSRRNYIFSLIGGLFIFLLTCAVFVIFDSFYFGYLSLSVESNMVKSPLDLIDKIVSFATRHSWKDILRFVSLEGKLVYSSLNYYATVVPWKSWLRLQLQPDFTHLLYNFPILAGPTIFLLLKYAVENSSNMYKDLMMEYKDMTGSDEKRKKKKKKHRSGKSSKHKQEEEEAFYEPIELAVMLAIFGLSFSRLQEVSHIAPIMTCLSVIFCEDLFGSKRKKLIQRLYTAYCITGVLVFGIFHQSGVVQWLLHESCASPSVTSNLIFYRTFRPPPSLLGDHTERFRIYNLGENITQEQLFAFLGELEMQSNEPIFIGASATVHFSDTEGVEIYQEFPAHLSVLDLPQNSYNLIKEGKFIVYRYVSKISAALQEET